MITTLTQVEQWLSIKPAEEVICWDTANAWHDLMVSYYRDQGVTPIRSEYDRAVIDSHMLDVRTSSDRSQPTRLHATYEPDLASFCYNLQKTPLHYKPTAGDLLNYLHTEGWRNAPSDTLYGWNDPAIFNAIFDDPARPEDVSWQRLDIVKTQGIDRFVYTSLQPPIFYYNKDASYRNVELNVLRDEWTELTDLLFRAAPETRHGFVLECTQINKIWVRAGLRMEDGETVTLFTNEEGDLGTWQRNGEKVARIV